MKQASRNWEKQEISHLSMLAFVLASLSFACLVLIEELRKHGVDITSTKQKSDLFQNQVQRS